MHFPPQKYSDVIIRYRDVDFHVHRLVLHRHSTVLETMFDALAGCSQEDEDDNDKENESKDELKPPHKKRRTSADRKPRLCLPLSKSSRDYESLTKPMEYGWVTTAAGMELFLRFLYFPDQYCFPPYLPLDDVDLLNPPPHKTSYSEPDDPEPLIAQIQRATASVQSDNNPSSNTVCPAHKRLLHRNGRTFACTTMLVPLAFYFDAKESCCSDASKFSPLSAV